MEKLKVAFIGKGEVKGMIFNKVAETDLGYIYSVGDHFEVFRKKIVNKIDWETKQPTGEQKETYPKSNSFGVWAWTFKSLALAKVQLYSFKQSHSSKTGV